MEVPVKDQIPRTTFEEITETLFKWWPHSGNEFLISINHLAEWKGKFKETAGGASRGGEIGSVKCRGEVRSKTGKGAKYQHCWRTEISQMG